MDIKLLQRQSVVRQTSELRRLVGLDDITSLSQYSDLGTSALHIAAWYNKADHVDELIKQGEDVNSRDKDGATPLHYAVRYKQRFQAGQRDTSRSGSRVIRSLVAAGAGVNNQDIYGSTPLYIAVQRGNEKATKALLLTKRINPELSDKRRQTPLHVAAKYNRVVQARMLVDEGVDIMSTDDTGVTPFHIACMEGHKNIASIILAVAKKNGNELQMVNAESNERESPLDLAIENRKLPMVKMCFKYCAILVKTCRDINNTPLHLAATAGDAEVAAMLIQRQPDLIEMTNIEQATPLHRAAQYNRKEVVQLLVNNNANIESSEMDGYTPLLTAAENGCNDVVEVLLESGADYTTISKSDQNALHMAVRYNHQVTLQMRGRRLIG